MNAREKTILHMKKAEIADDVEWEGISMDMVKKTLFRREQLYWPDSGVTTERPGMGVGLAISTARRAGEAGMFYEIPTFNFVDYVYRTDDATTQWIERRLPGDIIAIVARAPAEQGSGAVMVTIDNTVGQNPDVFCFTTARAFRAKGDELGWLNLADGVITRQGGDINLKVFGGADTEHARQLVTLLFVLLDHIAEGNVQPTFLVDPGKKLN